MTTKSLSAAQIKRRIGRDDTLLVLARIDGTMWASNRYWLTRAEPLEPFLSKHSLSDPGGYYIDDGTVRPLDAPPPVDLITRHLDLAQYTVPLTPVSVGHHDEICAPGPQGYLQLFRPAGRGARRIVAVLAGQLNWLEDIAPPLEDGRVYEMRLATTKRVNGPVAIIAEPLAPEPEDEAQPVLVAVVMPSRQRPKPAAADAPEPS